MTEPAPAVVRSAANPQFKALRLLAQDSTAWRKQGRIWLEGDHLCRAALGRGVVPELAVHAESCPPEHRLPAARVLVLADPLFAAISALESPARMGFIIPVPQPPALDPQAPTVVLDRLQDAGNVGTLLRSAAALGVRQVVALRGTAVHMAALRAHGACAAHRRSFSPVREALEAAETLSGATT